MQIQLKTGNTITISSYEFFFVLRDEDVELFYESCVADDLGTYIDNPFSNKASMGRLEFEDTPEYDDEEEK